MQQNLIAGQQDYQRLSDARLMELYKRAFPSVVRVVSRMGGTMADTKDIFHDSLIIYWEQQKAGKSIRGSAIGYILGISKHLCIRKFHQTNRVISLSSFEKEIEIPADFYPSINQRRLLRLLDFTGRRCLELLRAFYYESLPAKEIAEKLGFSNEHSASTQKYKCVEKIKKIIKEKSWNYEDFLE